MSNKNLWITEMDDMGWNKHTCPNCGYVKRTDIHVSLGWDYCPKCGELLNGHLEEPSVYYVEEAVSFIHNKTGIDEQLVRDVLEAEEDYMRSLGLIVEIEE